MREVLSPFRVSLPFWHLYAAQYASTHRQSGGWTRMLSPRIFSQFKRLLVIEPLTRARNPSLRASAFGHISASLSPGALRVLQPLRPCGVAVPRIQAIVAFVVSPPQACGFPSASLPRGCSARNTIITAVRGTSAPDTSHCRPRGVAPRKPAVTSRIAHLTASPLVGALRVLLGGHVFIAANIAHTLRAMPPARRAVPGRLRAERCYFASAASMSSSLVEKRACNFSSSVFVRYYLCCFMTFVNLCSPCAMLLSYVPVLHTRYLERWGRHISTLERRFCERMSRGQPV